MKKTAAVSIAFSLTSFALGGPAVDGFNELDIGTLSGHLQGLSMYRDFEGASAEDSAYSTTLGLQLDYASPELVGLTLGVSYVGVGVIDSKDHDKRSSPGEYLVGNGRVNLLNEAYVAYSMDVFGLAESSIAAGRRVVNGEIFRADAFRQKSRSVEVAMIEIGDIPKTRILAGHAWELSNWIDSGNLWKFENFDNWGTDRIAWAEVINNGFDRLEIAVFDAYAEDLSNLIGARARLTLSDQSALLGYYRNESDVGDSTSQHSDVFGLSAEQRIGPVTIEGGYFGVHGSSLRFQETTTGINHALGLSMMIYAQQFAGGTDTFYAKAVTTLKRTGTVLYALYNYTLHDEDETGLNSGQELNVVIKQPCPQIEGLTFAFKGGVGYRDAAAGADNTEASDARLFVTYSF